MTVIEKTKTTQIDEELKKSYLDYAMSVIISRALPDIRDGLKPVQRRIIYSAWDNGYKNDKSFVKSARIVGNVMGGLHPHGDSSIYDAMVRMAQPWNMMAPLIDGQGNFGSIDADPQAAARYTEARLTKISETLLLDLHKDTVSWSPNYDETMKEPDVLPAAFPNLLINGASGVAVGMATNIPPHNLGEIIDGTIAYIDKPKISIQEFLSIVKGPDFPTGGVVINSQDFLEIYNSGRGPITIRGKAQLESLPFSKKKGIVITEIPFQVVKANLVKQLAELTVKPDPKDVNNKKKSKYIEGISDVRDESDREGIRIVVELKSGVNGQDILELLYKVTQLEEKFSYNMLAITKGRPETLSLLDIIREFIEFRKDVVTKRLTFDLNAFKKQANILIGLVVAVLNIDAVLEIIKGSSNPASAKEKLISTRWKAKSIEPYLSIIGHTLEKGEYLLNEDQAKAILDLRLHRLTGLERDKIEKELTEIAKEVQKIQEILGSEKKLMSLIKSELNDLKKQFATPRKTEIL